MLLTLSQYAPHTLHTRSNGYIVMYGHYNVLGYNSPPLLQSRPELAQSGRPLYQFGFEILKNVGHLVKPIEMFSQVMHSDSRSTVLAIIFMY